VSLRRLELTDFRIFPQASFVPEREGTTVLTGANGTGKTSVLEALAYLGSRRSFRGAPLEALVRGGAGSAIVRAEFEGADSPVTVEAEIRPGGRARTQVNHKVRTARKDLAAAAPCTVFSPVDLALVSGAPRGRRDLLDDALGALDAPGARAADDVERVLRQRGALLRQAAGRPTPEVTASLDVWDQRLAEAGARLVSARAALAAALAELVGVAYARLAGAPGEHLVSMSYAPSWQGDLRAALAASRQEDVRRAVNTVGPHRDDLVLGVEGREARTHASQGEQRCLALALRLGVHRLVCARTPLRPVLLLDDVFSELDPARSRALVEELPAGQSIVTTAVPLPAGMEVARVVAVTELAGAAR
jgi:DNA replication and repair protein RecF